MDMIWLLAGVLVVLIVIGMPLGFAIIMSCMLVIFVEGSIPMAIVGQRIFSGMESFVLLAIPLFLLAGNLMAPGGMSERLFIFANNLVGRFRGGLAMSNVLTSILFGGISGSAVADTSVVGRLFIPAMTSRGYSPEYAVAVTAASSPIAPIIPPSIGFIVYGYLTGESIVRLFVAGLIPGLLYGGALLLLTWYMARRHDFPVDRPVPAREVGRSFGAAFFAVAMPVFIVTGIVGGVFTVTECAAIAVVYSACVGFFFYRELDMRAFYKAVVDAARMTAVIMIIVGGARLFAWVLGYYQVPMAFTTWVTTNIDNPLVFLALVNVFLFIVGTFMENNSAKVMLILLLYPVAVGLGVDGIHFGVIMTVTMVLGLITPPVGLCLSIACRIGDVSLARGTVAVLPFLLTGIGVVVLVTLFPELSLWLPNTVLGLR